jgi:hypothetical protein
LTALELQDVSLAIFWALWGFTDSLTFSWAPWHLTTPPEEAPWRILLMTSNWPLGVVWKAVIFHLPQLLLHTITWSLWHVNFMTGTPPLAICKKEQELRQFINFISLFQ